MISAGVFLGHTNPLPTARFITWQEFADRRNARQTPLWRRLHRFLRCRKLLRLDVGRPDHLGPLLSVIGNEVCRRQRRPRQRRDGQIVKPRFQFGIGKGSN